MHEKLSFDSNGVIPLALYVHWPFCVSKCPYCDFNSHVRSEINEAAWENALLTDMAYEAELNPNRKLSSIFFGGGTPSLMPPALVEKLISQAEHYWGFEEGIEITLEANPSSVEAAKFNDLAHAGINRVSLGLQSLDDLTLEFLGRAHSVSEGLGALDIAQNAFARTSFDLIYARPNQTPDKWNRELTRALGFGTDHLSLYQLTIEPATRFETLVRTGALIPADEDTCADLYTMTQEITAAANMPSYETSNHAREGQQSRHNLIYWRYQDYIGIGPGAHGRRPNTGIAHGRRPENSAHDAAYYATERHKKPENYLSAIPRNRHGIKAETLLSAETRAMEAMMMGLRLREGIDLSVIALKTGIAQDDLIDAAALHKLIDMEFMRASDTRIMLTNKAMPLLDAILPQIIKIEA